MRETFVLRDGELTPKHLASPHPRQGRRLGDAPYIRTDGMDAIRSMADGLIYDSKSAYERSVRASGCEIVGNDLGGFSAPSGYDPGAIERDIKTGIEQAAAGYRPPAPMTDIFGSEA